MVSGGKVGFNSITYNAGMFKPYHNMAMTSTYVAISYMCMSALNLD